MKILFSIAVLFVMLSMPIYALEKAQGDLSKILQGVSAYAMAPEKSLNRF